MWTIGRKKFEFEIGDEETPPAKQTFAIDISKGKIGSGNETGSLAFPDIEALALVIAEQANIYKVGAMVQGVPRELPPEFQSSSEAGMGTQQSRYYPSQSAKTLLSLVNWILPHIWLPLFRRLVLFRTKLTNLSNFKWRWHKMGCW